MILHYIKKISYIYLQNYTSFSLGVWLNVFAGLVNSMGNTVSIFMALYLINRLHFSELQSSGIIAANAIGMIIGAYLGGYLCDRYNSNKVAYFSLIGSGSTIGLFPFFNDIFALSAIAFIAGLAYGAFRPANTLTLFANCDETDRVKVNSLYRVGSNLGSGFGTAVGGFLAVFSYEFIYWFNALTNIIGALLLIIFANTFKIHAISKKITRLPLTLATFFSNRIFILLSIVLFVNMLIIMQIRAPYEIYLQNQYQMSTKSIGYLFLLNSLMIVLLEVPVINALKRLNQIKVAMTGSLLITLGMFLLPFGNSLAFAFVSCFIWSFGQILFISPMFVLAIENTPKTHSGTFMGIYQMVFSSAVMAAPLLGTLVSPIDDGSFIWHLCGLLGIISLFGFNYLYFEAKNLLKSSKGLLIN